jgi:hypothetical protein
MKNYIVKLSKELFEIKTKIEEELRKGNKTDEQLYNLIIKAIEYLRNNRTGEPLSKKLPIYKYFENKFGINNLFILDVGKGARAFYTNVSQDEFSILQIILEVHKTHKEYERKGKY